MAKVLVAEDDTMLSSLLMSHLQREGCEAKAVYDGAAAIDEVKKWHPEVVLLDIMMPIKTGWDVLKVIQDDASLASSIAVVIISNLEAQDAVAKAKQLGATDYLVKATTSLGQIVERVKTVQPGQSFEGVVYDT